MTKEDDEDVKRRLEEHESRVAYARSIEVFVKALEELLQRFERGIARMDRWLHSLAGFTVILLIASIFLAIAVSVFL